MKQDFATKYWDVGNEDMHRYQALMYSSEQQLCIKKPEVLIH